MRSARWFVSNVQTHLGRPYDQRAYPHIAAPGGPCDALDDNYTLEIVLQWASRLGKTFFGQSATMYYADQDSRPSMFASVDQKLATDVVARTYKMIEQCVPLRGRLLPEHLRKKVNISLGAFQCVVAWSRSVSTLADKGIQFGHANELDKWEHVSTSGEADPEKLFSDRGKEFPTRKFLYESTPQMKRRSRIERRLLQSTNCYMHVPCPHCNRYQKLVFGKDTVYGIKWDKMPNGRHDKELARTTARYVCQHCQGKVLDHHRSGMMRMGVWVPEGCKVNDKKALRAAKRWYDDLFSDAGSDGAELWQGWSKADWIRGKPMRDGPDAGYQLSSLYALSLGWGDIAAEFVSCKDSPQLLRNFINQWLGETWEIRNSEQTWEQLGKKIIHSTPMWMVPEWASVLTVGVDRQQNSIPWLVDAWGPEMRHATIAYGEFEEWDQLLDMVIQRHYAHADGGDSLQPIMTLVDSGHPEGVYEFCNGCLQKKFPVYPCKGSSRDLESDYIISKLKPGSAYPGLPLIHVDTIRSQLWLNRVLDEVPPDSAGGMSLFHGSLHEHQDLLEQLLNDASVQELDKSNNPRELWQRIDAAVPNDFRDCRRYSRTGCLIATRGGTIKPRIAKPKSKTKPVATSGISRADGRPWIPERH